MGVGPLEHSGDGGRSGRIHLLPAGQEGEGSLGDAVILSRLDQVVNWGRKNSLWPIPFGTACCAIEFMGVVSSIFDISRFGAELVRFSPRQADLMIVAGTVTYKMATRIKLLYDQMPEPKYVLSMGSCANCGGLFSPGYSVLKGVDQVVPVDYYIPGCPPRPEELLEGLIAIQRKMESERGWLKRLWAHGRQTVLGEAHPRASAKVVPH
jgi:NADH-quinone oxidoreductase subunit B